MGTQDTSGEKESQDTSNEKVERYNICGQPYTVENLTPEQEQLRYIKSIKYNVQFFAWLLIIGIVIIVLDAILGLFGYYIFSNY